MTNGNNKEKKMKLVGWIGDASKNLFKWGGSEAKKEAAHDAAEFNTIIADLENIPTTSVKEVEDWLGSFDEKLKKMKHSPTVEVPTKMLFQKFVKPMFNTLDLVPHSELSEETLKVIGLTAGSLALGLAAYAAGMVVETLSLGQIDGFDKFWDQVVKATGVFRISALMTTLPMTLSVMRPLGYEYNSIYRTFKPVMKEIVRWYGRGHIGDKGMKQFMLWHGIEDEWFDEYKRSASRETSYFMLNAIAREGMYDEDKFQFWLSDAGYGAYPIMSDMLTEYERDYGLTAPGETQIDFLLRNYRKMSEKAEFSGIQSLAKKSYIRGDITWETFDMFLTKIGKPEIVRNMIKTAADLEMADVERDLTLSVWQKAYRVNRITVEELEAKLKDLGYSDDSISHLIYMEDLRKSEDPAELTRAQIEGIFRRHGIEEAEFRARLKNMNYSDRDINLMVDDAKKRMET